ncbi:YcdB/YcdC domain-containing protein [Paenibacillus sanguinis]|uniref:YcdB/YcdC domain-containing protein n=1 Tax=Paenibacillus sanguinis TaxID=225906 RepID=UPI00196A0291|nr:YcdB/YcdC domain-containing protein [Paenibacillus sanguinis]
MMAIEQLDMSRLWQYWEEELGLTGLYRQASLIRQELSSTYDTEYSIELEWVPESGQDKEEGNPPGSAMVKLDGRTRELRSFYIVHNREARPQQGTAGIDITPQQAKARALQWVERFAGLTEQAGSLELVQMNDRDEGTMFAFRRTWNGIPFYPPMPIHVEVARNGQVVAYSDYSDHLLQDIPVCDPPQSPPSSEQARGIARAAFELIYVPDSSQSPAWCYGVGETFLNTTTGETLTYERHAPFLGQPPLNRRLFWMNDSMAGQTEL